MELFTVHSHWLFVGLLVFLAAIYPMYGYVDRPMKADMDADRSKILKTMDMGDYYLAREEGGRMVFHKQSILKRMLSIGQDTIIITREGAGIVVSGLRKEVVKVDYRLRAQFE
ncbi:MAG: hypothetical protein LBU95_03340 [Rikenellaceae bacterium]|nr:hypothetical protein [Rikenellaceae bacterium]